MPTYDFTRWSGGHERVTADEVTFPAGALVFRNGDSLILAVKPNDWNNVREVGHPDQDTTATGSHPAQVTGG